MSEDEARDCHCKTRVVVVHKRARRRFQPFGFMAWLPGFQFWRGVLILGIVWYGLRIFTPNWDVPYILGASCSPTENPQPRGVVGAAYEAGNALRVAATERPSVREIRGRLMEASQKAGDIFASLEDGFTGSTPSENAFYEYEPIAPETLTAGVSGCEPCDTSDGTTTVEDLSGSKAVVAARALQAAGFTGSDLVTAVEIAGAESSFDPGRPNQHSSARGLMQIMMSLHAEKFAPGESWSDPYANARVARKLWVESGWAPWASSQANWGRYASQARAAVAALGRSDDSSTRFVNVSSSGEPHVGDSGSVPTQPVALKAASFIRSEFGFNGTIGGSANSGHMEGSAHYSGLALDVMTYGDTAEGQRIFDYFAGPGYKPFGVDNVIFNKMIYNAGRGLHDYGDHGSDTANHVDHVHIDFHPTGGSGSTPAAAAITAAACAAPAGAVAADGMRIGTFNILGEKHTASGTWRGRFTETVSLLNNEGVSVAGLQEVMPGNQRRAVSAMPGWDSYGDWDAVTAWRTDTWERVSAELVQIPMFSRDRQVPLVTLRHRDTGETVTFLNVHNPNVWVGSTKAQQAEAFRRELSVVDSASSPVIWLGDTNDRAFEAKAVSHGYTSAGTRSRIDQIVGRGVGFSTPRRIETPASDHALHVVDVQVGRSS